METLENINLNDYILKNYDKYIDLTIDGYNVLIKLLNFCYASYIPLVSFMQYFNLNKVIFMDIFDYICNPDNIEQIKNYGIKCQNINLNTTNNSVRKAR